jgi:hypothetical protein
MDTACSTIGEKRDTYRAVGGKALQERDHWKTMMELGDSMKMDLKRFKIE